MNKKIVSSILAIITLFSAVSSTLTAEAVTAGSTSAGDSVQFGVNVEYHSPEEVAEYLTENKVYYNVPVVYSEEPSCKAPYSAGKMSDETIDNALRLLNAMRYIAGISHNVGLNDSYGEAAQAASVISAAHQTINHFPEKPADMSDEFYNLAKRGCGSSNLAAGNFSLNYAIFGWIDDGDYYNIDRVGHRRWILYPKMCNTGFGAAFEPSSYYGGYFSMYVFDYDGWYSSENTEIGVAWPAQSMPVDYFGAYSPWSVSMGESIDINSTVVKLQRLSDKKTWTFSADKSDGDFYVNNEGYGQRGCIIFRPNDIDQYSANDVFSVSVSTDKGNFDYDVTFFDIIDYLSNIGDIDEDGEITSADALQVLRASVGLEHFDDAKKTIADVDGDGSITSSDSLAILRYSVGIADEGIRIK